MLRSFFWSSNPGLMNQIPSCPLYHSPHGRRDRQWNDSYHPVGQFQGVLKCHTVQMRGQLI